jgi:glycosyltransferase involved in cell wall biosynthesis
MTDTVSDLVSTIIPVYNRPQMLREAVASVLAQTYRPIEIIVVDDGSTDETPRVAEALAAEHPEEIRFVRKENSGPGPTREAGRQMARGEFIQYLDSDDLLRPRKFEIMVRALRERPNAEPPTGISACIRKMDHPLPLLTRNPGLPGRPCFREFWQIVGGTPTRRSSGGRYATRWDRGAI